jgi:hypothetical protein
MLASNLFLRSTPLIYNSAWAFEDIAMNQPEFGNEESLAVNDMPARHKAVSKKKLRQHAKKALEKAREAKREAVKQEKKALKQMAEAEKHCAKAAVKKTKAEQHLAKFTQRTQAALQALELAKTEYDVLKGTTAGNTEPLAEVPVAEAPATEGKPA